MADLSFPGNFEDLKELRKYKKQICNQYPDQNVVVYDYRYKYPIVHSIENNKSRMGFCGLNDGVVRGSDMLGKNNQSMEYIFAPKWNKTVHLTTDSMLENVDIPVNCCHFPTLWVKEATELGTTIQKVSSKISWHCHPDYSQHLLKGLGVSAKNFRILCNTRYMDLPAFKRLISFGFSEKDIYTCDEMSCYINEDFDAECVKYMIENHTTRGFSSYSYRDYLRMRKDLPTPVKRQWPKCPNLKKYILAEWHNRIMRAYNSLQDEITAEKNKVQQSKYFEKVYPKAKEFELADEVYSIICPEQVTSLLAEGRTLHHCVGSYINSVASGNEYILFLRKTSDLDTPFFTINILPNKRVRQIHGLCNCNLPNEIKPFIKKWADKFGLDISNCNGVYCHL